jgi:hypothetical protein
MKRMIWLLPVLLNNLGLAQTQIPLKDLSDFKPQAGNWQIVGDVSMNRNASPVSHAPGEKKSKKSKVEAIPAYQFSSGDGILLNANTAEKKDSLVTKWEKDDIKFDFYLMITKR